MRPLIKFIYLLALLSISFYAVNASDSTKNFIYTVVLHDAEEPYLSISVPLGNKHFQGEEQIIPFQKSAQMSDLKCDAKVILPNDSSQMAIPENCQILSWKNKLKPWGVDGISIEQLSFYNKENKRGVLSGRTSLINLQTSLLSSVRVVNSSGELLAEGIVPPATSAPLFLPFGNWLKSKQEAIGVTFFIDEQEFLKGTGNWPVYQRGMAWLASAVNGTERLSDLNVIWVANKVNKEDINGAAGTSHLLLNYPMDGTRLEGLVEAKALLVLFHEHYHQLDPGIGSEGWHGESLGTWFALEAFGKVNADNSHLNDIHSYFIDSERPVSKTLRSIVRASKGGDQSGYELMYTHGATYWHSIDVLLQTESNGTLDLMTVFQKIMRHAKKPDFDLVLEVRKHVSPSAHKAFDKITLKYVGE